MRTSLTYAAVLVTAVLPLVAQSRVPDLSGRWRLVQPTASERAADTLVVSSPDELLITHTPRRITVEHPSEPGTHPAAGTFEYGSGGWVGGLPGSDNAEHGTWGVTHIGTQLMISRTTNYPPEAHGARAPVTVGSMWRLDTPDRLVIEFGEERPGQRPKLATRVYSRVAQPQ